MSTTVEDIQVLHDMGLLVDACDEQGVSINTNLNIITEERDMNKQRRIIVRVPATKKSNVVSVDVVRMAYNALTGDPTTRLTARTVQAKDIATWIDEEMCTAVDVDSVHSAMLELRRVPGATVSL